MKKLMISALAIVTLLFVGCNSIPIKSDNGSFRNTFDSEYYKKTTYFCMHDSCQKTIVNADLDDVIQQGLITAYSLNKYAVVYSRATKNGHRSTLDDDYLFIYFFRIYIENTTMGFKIMIIENRSSIKKYSDFIIYQEVSINEKGEYIIRENISKDEATRKRIKWNDVR